MATKSTTARVNQQHKDAGEGIIFARQLEIMKPDVYRVAYPMLRYAEVIPVSPDKNPYAQVISYKMWDISGSAKIIANYADDLPRADVGGREYFMQVHTLGTSVGWTDFDIGAAQMAGQSLDSAKLMAANEIIQRLADKLAFFGDSTVNLFGLTNLPNMPNTVVPTYDAVVTWAAKIAKGDLGKEAVIADLLLPFTRMSTLTKNLEVPDTLLMAPTTWAQLSATPRSAASDLTLLEFFKKAHPEITIITVPHLETSGTGGTKQMILMRRDKSKLELEIPQDVYVRDPERRGLEWIVAITMRFGGVLCRYPLSLDSSYGM